MNTKYQPLLITLVYAVLVGLTIVTYQVGETQAHSLDLSLLVFAIALVKGVLISEQFMRLGSVKGIWRWPVLIWLILVSIVIYLAFSA
mgnify:CR=1 FL=1